jgi:hypothetical protein
VNGFLRLKVPQRYTDTKLFFPEACLQGQNPNNYWKKISGGLDFRKESMYLCPRFLSEHSPDPVAQSVEHLTFNQGVMGSSPIGITTCKANFLIIRLLAFFIF